MKQATEMDFLRDWPPFMLLVDTAVEVANSREKGLVTDVDDKLLNENPENNKPLTVSGSYDEEEQHKTLTADDESMRKKIIVIKLFGTDIICSEESEAERHVKKAEERVDDRKRGLELGEYGCSREKKRSRRQKDASCGHQHQPIPDFPETFKEMILGMEGSDVKFIIQKRLYSTDLNDHHGRLSVPLNQVKTEFLTDEEKNVLEGGSKQGIEVVMIEPCFRRRELRLRRWEMKKQNGKPSSVQYVFTRGWNLVAKENDLKKGQLIQIWSFRADSKLCFALVIVDR